MGKLSQVYIEVGYIDSLADIDRIPIHLPKVRITLRASQDLLNSSLTNAGVQLIISLEIAAKVSLINVHDFHKFRIIK